MAKNTISILESIKKKIGKIDQKSATPEAVLALGDEFEYVAHSKKEEAAAPVVEEIKTQNSEPIFKDDLGFEDVKTENQNQTQPANSSADAGFKLEDLDLDNETSIVQSAAILPETQLQNNNALEPFSFDETLAQTKAEGVAEGVAEEEDEFEDEDFDESAFDEEDYEDEVEIDEEEIDLDAIEAELEEISKIGSEPLPTTDNELSLDAADDLNLDDLQLDQPAPQEEKKEIHEPDLELEELDAQLKNLESEKASQTAPEKVEEVDFALPKNVQEEQDQPILEQPKPVEKTEDFDFDKWLENEDASKESKPAEVLAEPAKAEPAPLEEVVFEQPILEQKIEPEISPHKEIELEFEKEIMGLRPEVAPNKVESQVQISSTIPEISAPAFVQAAPIPAFQMNQAEKKPLISEQTVLQTTQSLQKLVDAKNVIAGISSFSQSPALAELASELLEPKLEKWLNENLGEMVDKIVREEIKKLIP